MNGLSLCSGIGGLELGLKLALGDSYRTVCYVEREAYPAACLVKRMEEGFLDEAPIWDDVTTFDGRPWRGLVDIVTAGFPCQSFSTAARGRNVPGGTWDFIARSIGESMPGLVFLENVGLSAFTQPFMDLRSMDYSVSSLYEADAAELGAPHRRRRFFLLAYANGQEQLVRTLHAQMARVSKIPRPWNGWPKLPRVDDGVPNRVERDRALGNAVVPVVAAKAFVELIRRKTDA